MTTSHRHPAPLSPPEDIVRLPPVRMPGVPPALRLQTSPAVRAVIPARLMLRRAERKAQRLWSEHGGIREQALRMMQAIVTGTAREPELEDLARRHVIEKQAWEALFWRPWRHRHIGEASRERLHAACSSGRGVVLSSCHIGPYFCKAKTLTDLGIEPYVVSGEWFFEPPGGDWWGRRLARWRNGVPDIPLVRPRGTFPLLAELLRGGEHVLVYFDMPGRHRTTFLGKPVMLVDGSARLAVEADALVLPLLSRRDGHRIWVDADEPLDPRAFAGVEELHAELARIHERMILADPAAMADPAEFGWGQEAGPDGWRRPPREEPGAERSRS